MRPRYGAVGKHGSIAVVERFILTLKQACKCLPLVPLRAITMCRQMASFVVWYNEHRPHTSSQAARQMRPSISGSPPIGDHATNRDNGHEVRPAPDLGR